jgi:hypothetical protein
LEKGDFRGISGGYFKSPLPPFFKGDYLPLDIRFQMCYLGNHQGLKEVPDENQDRSPDDYG